jgi:hypothetical protein
LGQLALNYANERLTRAEASNHFLAKGFKFNLFQERFDNGEGYVGF